MVDNRSGATSDSAASTRTGGGGGGRKLGWLPWLLGALIVLGGLTAIDLAFYRDDIHDEAHEEAEHEETEAGTGEEGDETDTGTNLVEPRDEDAETSDDDH